jgi:UDP-N-acetylmuramyl pentapeptide synthase
MTTRDQEEQDLTIEQMTMNIEKMRADMQAENRRFTLQIVGTIAVTAAATATVMGLILHLLGKV